MILRFKLYSIACGATALLSTTPRGSDAFTTVVQRTSSSSSRGTNNNNVVRHSSLSPDWDNDDFLSSLGGTQEEKEAANDQYYKQAENRAAMDEWRMKQLEKNPKGPSPEFFKKMGMSADNTNAAGATTQAPPTQQQPPQQVQPQQMMQQPPQQPQMQPPPPQMAVPPPPPSAQQPQQQQFYDANGNPVSMPMVYDANGNLVPFNPSAGMQQQPAVAQPPVQPAQQQQMQQPIIIEPPLPPKTKGTDDPRPVGRNPDAYTMSNTADVYFAQLKQDSKVRKIARMSGDVDKANKVFDDESVHRIGESWNENPYTKEKNLAEARAEIEGTVRLQVQGGEAPPVTSGISYKEKLEQMKAKRAGGGTIGVKAAVVTPPLPPPPKVVEQTPPPPPPPKVVEQTPPPPPPPKMDAPKVGMPAPTQVVPKATTPPPPQQQQPKIGQTMPTNVVPVTKPPPSPPVVTAPVSAEPVGPADEEDIRRKVRTLQGLLLKHRGGPGFGAGRLKAPEAQRLEDTLEEVKALLRTESGGGAAAAAAAPAVESKPVAAAPAAPVVESKPVVPAQPVATTPPAKPVVEAPPPPAVPKPAKGTTTTTAVVNNDAFTESLTRVESALTSYKSSPGNRDAMMKLTESLMFAIGACNKAIAETELSKHKATMDAGPSSAAVASAAAQPMMGFPTSYEVTKPDDDDEVAPTPATAADNEKKLEDVYNALVNARGSGGKLGLKNISGNEANALAEKLQTMRGVLLDELNNGK